MAGLVPAIHVCSPRWGKKDVDARDKPGHDGFLPGALASSYPANHLAGTVTSAGNSTIKNSTTSCAIMKGQTPLMISSMLILDTPHTTFSTTPTGGVIRPMALLMMNSTPK